VRLLLLLGIPIVDLYLLVVVARHLGGWPVLGFVVASALVGWWLARRQTRRVMEGFRGARAGRAAPSDGLLSAGLTAVAGLLLIVPGVLSSVAGLVLLVAPVRRWISRLAHGWFERRMVGLQVAGGGLEAVLGGRAGPIARDDRAAVIDVEAVEPPGPRGDS